MSDARTVWKQRVSSWRASGETAKKFSAARGFSAGTLKWWASQLRKTEPVPVVRVAQVVRSPIERGAQHGAIIVDALEANIRITIEPGADRAALALVLDLVGPQDR